MIRHQVPLDDLAFLLLRQFPEDPSKLPPNLAIQRPPAAFRDKHHMIFAFPTCVPQTLVVLHLRPPFVNFERFTKWRLPGTPGTVKLRGSSGRAGGFPVGLIFESRPTKGFFIAKLSNDYLNVEKQTSFIQAPLEGGSLVHFDGLYYIVGSQMTAWSPNPNKYATAQKINGPWSKFKDIAPPEKKSYGSQSTFLLKVVGLRKTSVIFMGDQWKPRTQWDSRYLWMPLEIGGGTLRLPEPKPWCIDVKTGEVTISNTK